MVNCQNTQPTGEIQPLPLNKVIRMAVKGIRVRILRSLVVISSIVLAVSFLSYILLSEFGGFTYPATGPNAAEPIIKLEKNSLHDQEDAENQRVQTYWMVGLALIICFIGIINAMWMSVMERFREIGTMKCLGALDGFILRLFVTESIVYGMAGSMAGFLLGFLLAYGEGFFLYGFEVAALMPGKQVLWIGCVTFLGGTLLTVIGAVYPAHRAAKMPPVTALRAEI